MSVINIAIVATAMPLFADSDVNLTNQFFE